MCPLKMKSLFPQFCGAPASKPTDLESQMLSALVFPVLDCKAYMGLRTLSPVREPLQYTYSLLCGLPILGGNMSLYLLPVLLWFLLCVFRFQPFSSTVVL